MQIDFKFVTLASLLALSACGNGSDHTANPQQGGTAIAATGNPAALTSSGEPHRRDQGAPVGSDDDYQPYGDPSLTTDTEPPRDIDPLDRVKQYIDADLPTREATIARKDVPATIPANANVIGAWAAPRPWPLIAIHNTLLPDGRFMTYGTDAGGRQTGKFIYDVWDYTAPRIDQGHLTLPNETITDLFCSSQTLLPSTGQLLINGGDTWTGTSTTNTGNNNSNLFTPTSNTLRAGNNMNRARWYSSVTTLTDGLQYIQGGSGGSDFPERYNAGGTYTLLSGAPTNGIDFYYPANHIAPDGRVFGYDRAGRMYYVDPSGTGYLDRLTNVSSSFVGIGSASAMIAPFKIIQTAGNSNGVLQIDISGPLPVVTEKASLSSKRQEHNTVVTPDGRLFLFGGSATWNVLDGAKTTAEMYDPVANTWTELAAGVNPRLYHSTALLLPDASILVAGGGAPGPLVNTNAEIYYPPYLFTAGGATAARPVITSAPTTITPGNRYSFQLASSAALSSVVLMRSGSVTHSINFDQRRVPLTFQQYGSTVNIELPDSGAVIPPGYWMLFAFNSAGVPSVAKIVRMNTGDPFRIGADWTGRYGSATGTEFELACSAGQVLVGVNGYAGVNGLGSVTVNQVQPRCVAVGANGSWTGSPVNGATRGAAVGSTFTSTCPSGQAVSGFSARSGTVIDQLTLQCRPLASAGRVTGTASSLTPVGGPGGTSRAVRSCGNEHPAHALYGRYGANINAFGLLCRGDIEPANRMPTLGALADRTDIVNTAISLPTSASDADGDTLAWSATGLPPGVTISTSTGLLSGTPGTAGSYAVTVTVTDGFYRTVRSFTWTIQLPAVDTDGDGIPNASDPDDDNDGAPDASDAFPLDPTESLDTDGDSIGNNADTDDDGDGVPDIDDAGPLDPGVGQIALATIVTGLTTSPSAAGAAGTVQAVLSDSLSAITYRWDFGDGQTASTSTPATTHVWNSAGRYQISMTATRGSLTVTRTLWKTVHGPLTARKPVNSTSVALHERAAADDLVAVVNPDHDSITVVNAVTEARLGIIAVGRDPRGVASDGASRIYVTNKADSTLSEIDPVARSVVATITLPVGSSPHGIVIDTATRTAFVALEGRSSIVKINLTSRTITAERTLAGAPRHVALTADGTRLFASRFISAPVPGESTRTLAASGGGGEVYVLQTASLTLANTVGFGYDTGPDTENSARGVPNYLQAPVITPDGLRAFVPFKSDNIFRGVLRDGNPREHDRLVRAKLGRFLTGSLVEERSARLDFDNNSPPSAAALDPFGNYLYLVHEGSRFLEVIDAWTGGTLATVILQRAPQGVVVSADGGKVFVLNSLSRTLSILDARALMAGTASDVSVSRHLALTTSESLAANVLLGKQLFHDALDPRLVSQNYLACASCHDEAGNDGRTWDFADVGEGLRNTIDLRGRGGNAHGRVHWSANFDEIQDFENDIRNVFKGTGLLSDADFSATSNTLGTPKAGRSSDLDALAAYLMSETRVGTSPYRTASSGLTADAQAGRQLFVDLACASCHSGTGFTDSPGATLHNIGTIDADSGNRLGGSLSGLDTPTLRGLWLSAPYLHDGSARNVNDAIRAHTAGSAGGTAIAALSNVQLDQLATYLLSIDDNETSAPANDNDGDGIPDAIDPDDDNDGVTDTTDRFPTDPTESVDTDIDGIGNNADTDDDGDGTPDANDPAPLDPTITGSGTGSSCNLISNGGFETDLSGWFSNASPVRIVDAARGSGAIQFSGGWLASVVSINGNAVHVLSGQFRASGPSGWAGYGVDYLDAAGNEIGEQVRSLVNAQAWTEFTLPLEPPAGTAFMRSWFIADTGRTLALDAVDLRRSGCIDGGGTGNAAPMVATPPTQIGEVGKPVTLAIVASDANGDGLSYAASGLPAGLSINAASGLISGTPSAESAATTTVTVSDGTASTVVTFQWLITQPGGAAACNMITDGGFENSLGPWRSNTSLARTTTARSGLNSLQFTGGWIGVTMPVTPGTSYSFTGQYLSASTSAWAGFGFDWIDASGNEVAEEVRTLNPTATWTAMELTAVAPAGASSINLWVYADSTRTMLLDDLDLRATGCSGGTTSSCNLAPNPGFEQGLVNWGSSTNPIVVSDAAAGSQAVSLNNGWISNVIRAEPGRTYVGSAQVKVSGVSDWAGMGLSFVDVNDQLLDSVAIGIDNRSTFGAASVSKTSPPGTAKIQFWFNAGAGRTMVLDQTDLRLSECQ